MEEKEPKDVDLEQELEALYRKVASADPPGDSSHPFQQLNTGTAPPEEQGLPERTNNYPMPKKEGSTYRLLLTLTGVFFPLALLCMVAIFFWPTIYYFEYLNSGEKVYPVRINKLTGETSYFNGTEWLSPPVTTAIRKPVSEKIINPSAIIPPETGKNKAQAAELPLVPTTLKSRDKAKYVIQIKAFPENGKNDAHAFMKDVRKRVPEVQMKTVRIAGHGIWYRIWVGNFASIKEASNNVKKLKLSESYPDSFIRKESGE
jgi:hypothetical protein